VNVYMLMLTFIYILLLLTGAESEDKSGKGRKMMRWKTDRRSDESINTNAGVANAASGRLLTLAGISFF